MSILQTIAKPNTTVLNLFENNRLTSEGNNLNLGIIGTVPFVTSPAPPIGTYAAGPFNDLNHFLTVLPTFGGQNFLNAISNWNEMTVELYVYFNTLSNFHIVMGMSASNGDFLIQEFADGRLRFSYAGTFTDTASPVVTTGAWYHIAAIFSPNGNKLFASLASSISQTPVISVAGTSPPDTVNDYRVGVYYLGGGITLDGYIDEITISNIDRSNNLPTRHV